MKLDRLNRLRLARAGDHQDVLKSGVYNWVSWFDERLHRCGFDCTCESRNVFVVGTETFGLRSCPPSASSIISTIGLLEPSRVMAARIAVPSSLGTVKSFTP